MLHREARKVPLASWDAPPGQSNANLVRHTFPVLPWAPILGVHTHPSFLKDLATLRSPTSSLTFLAFLHDQDRLLPFINRGSFTPTRREFSDYLAWAAQKVASH